MAWFLNRILAVFAMVGAAALAGHWLGSRSGLASLGAVLGAGVGILSWLLVDWHRGERLLDWLRGPKTEGAPRDTGRWGDLAYRIERALRAHETTIRQERDRLTQFLSAIEASPNGVLMLDAAGQIEWLNPMAAEHFGLDRQRDRMQRVTNLVRAPAFVAYLQVGNFHDPVIFSGPQGRNTLSVLVRAYGEGMQLVLSQDITERERSDAIHRHAAQFFG